MTLQRFPPGGTGRPAGGSVRSWDGGARNRTSAKKGIDNSHHRAAHSPPLDENSMKAPTPSTPNKRLQTSRAPRFQAVEAMSFDRYGICALAEPGRLDEDTTTP